MFCRTVVLTFDLDKDGVAYTAQVIVGHAHILAGVLLGHAHDQQRLIEVLKLHFPLGEIPPLPVPFNSWRRTTDRAERPQCV